MKVNIQTTPYIESSAQNPTCDACKCLSSVTIRTKDNKDVCKNCLDTRYENGLPKPTEVTAKYPVGSTIVEDSFPDTEPAEIETVPTTENPPEVEIVEEKEEEKVEEKAEERKPFFGKKKKSR